LVAIGLAAALVLAPSVAAAEVRSYVLAIGNNEAPPASKEGDADLSELHYADDDAASMAAFGRELGANTTLLTVFDADSQRRFPSLVDGARPPTLTELRRVVESLKHEFDADVRQGNDPVLVLFYSGHGVLTPGQPPALSLLDGPLTRQVLYEEILATLPARYVHIVVDACHAEAVVRPRDAHAVVSDVSEGDLGEYAERSTLRRFPHVGAILATSSAALANEWDALQRGVFTYEVLSALRGGADVNADGIIEYSELSAYIGAANAEVADPRARLSILVHPPAVNPRAPLVDTSPLRVRDATLAGPVPFHFLVEDARGNRIGELRPEQGFRFDLLVPVGEPLYVRSDDREAEIRPQPGATVTLASLAMTSNPARPRGSVGSSLRRGLFAAPFGPGFYRGFANARPEMTAVPVPVPTDSAPFVSRDSPVTPPSKVPAMASLAGAGALLATCVVATVVAVGASADYNRTNLEKPASDAKSRFETSRAIALGAGAGAAALGGLGLWLLVRPGGSPTVPAGGNAGTTAQQAPRAPAMEVGLSASWVW
jgi:hypothetical protein